MVNGWEFNPESYAIEIKPGRPARETSPAG
jgi:hypothetical protein